MGDSEELAHCYHHTARRLWLSRCLRLPECDVASVAAGPVESQAQPARRLRGRRPWRRSRRQRIVRARMTRSSSAGCGRRWRSRWSAPAPLCRHGDAAT